MSDPADQPNPHPPEPRHPFTYRAPAERDDDAADPPRDPVEETRRNDGVLLIAALLMGVLFAWTTISDPRTLVHLKTGEYLAGHGFFPPATDVFSATAGDQPWINLGWLADVFLSGLHALGGMTALTVLQAVGTVAALLLILACHRRGVSTWWASLVLVLAGVAMMPNFQAQPALFTLLGLALTLWLLSRYRREIDDRALWWLIPLFAVWANLDPRMFLGLAVLLLYGLGEILGTALGRPGFEDSPRRSRYWLAVGGSVLASLVNPFTWRAPLAAIDLYGRIDPAFRQHYAEVPSWRTLCHTRVFDQPVERWLDTALLASLLIGVVALVTLLLNRRRTDPGDASLWVGFTAFGVLAGREWPAAAVVFAVLAIRNAEEWYVHSFRQSPSTERGELLFARGGRVLTVLAFFALAALWLTGRVIPDDGRRPGRGLDPALANQLESLSQVLANAYDAKVFNYQAGQGDQLIWLGYRPFIDHRLGLYAVPGPDGAPNLITLHDHVRRALRVPDSNDPRTAKPEVWRAVLGKYDIVQALPRLTFPRPAYGAYFDLIGQQSWRLAQLGAAAALFYHVEPTDTALIRHLEKHGLNLSRMAFRDVEPLPEFPPLWPEPPGWTMKLSRPDPVPNPLARAQHCAQHFERIKAGKLQLAQPVAIALAYIGIRDCYRVLATDPQNVHAYQCLGQLFQMLYVNEQQLVDVPLLRRVYQAIDAYGQALRIDPNNPSIYENLVGIYLGLNRIDLARQARDRYEALAGKKFPDPADPAAAERIPATWKKIDAAIAQVAKQADEALKNEQPPLEVAAFAWRNGCTVLALKILAHNPELLENNPGAVLLKAKCLLESAQPKEAYELLMSIEQSVPQTGIRGWREPLALASLAIPDFERAGQLFRAEAHDALVAQLLTAMQAIPIGGQTAGFPLMQTTQIRNAMSVASQDIANHKLNAALCALDAGDIPMAEAELAELLKDYPLTLFTTITGFYLGQIRNEPSTIDLGAPAMDDDFARIEDKLDDQWILDRLEAAGPAVAPKPGE